MKYDRHGRPEEADGRCFGNWKMDTTEGRNGKDAILTLTERSTNFILMKKIEHGREAAHAARTAIRLSLPYRRDGVKTMTTDNGGEFSAHGKITKAMKGTAVYFADPYSSWQKGTDFSNLSNSFLKKYRPR